MAKKEKQEKTQVVRILEREKIEYEVHLFPDTMHDNFEILAYLNEDGFQVYKTLVTRANTKEYFVFLVPMVFNLDLKKAAKVVNVKSIEMIRQVELEPLTGYIHGGCSPIGMKKQFKTIVDISALDLETMIFSGGRRGMQVEIKPRDLEKLIDVQFENIAC